jgi:signal transduction histidine kinase
MHVRSDEYAGRNVTDVLPRAWDDRARFEMYVDALERKEVRQIERQSEADANSNWYHIVASPLDGDLAVWFADITKRKVQERELLEADRRKDEFLATLAHELRNPLAPILLAASLLNRIRAQDPMLPRIQGVIERQAIHMARLVDDLLDKSRLITGRFRLDRCRVELAAMLEQAVETCRPAMDVRHQQSDLRLPPRALAVHGDRTRLVQIFVNLLHNACKYTPENGMISIGATIRSNEIEISVSDNGIGITADALPHIFELFVQDARGLTLSNDGLGIGLAVVRELVQAHGGNVTASSPGSDSGSTFVVTLPLLGEEPAG